MTDDRTGVVIGDQGDVEGHRISANDNETVVEDGDVEGHRIAGNDNETVVEDN